MALLAPSDYYVLLEIFLFLAVAQLIHSAVRKIGFPEIVADLLAGMVIGSYAIGGVFDQATGTHLFEINAGVLLFADFSVVILLFSAGLGGGFTSLRRAGWPAVGVAIGGDLLSFGISFLVFSRFYPLDAALFIAVATAATSAVAAASLLKSTKVGHTPGGELFMNASAIDDVVALVMLSVVLAILSGTTDPLRLTGSVVTSVVAWIVLLLVAVVLVPRVFRLKPLREIETAPFTILFILIAVVLALGFSPVIGAFIAGLAVAESLVADRTREITAVLVAVFGSLFFIVVGAEFEIDQLLDPTLVVLAVVLTGLAIAGKLVGVFPFARRRLDPPRAAWAVAIGMVPRGEIGLIVGAIGYTTGVLTQQMLGEIVVMAILTTLIGSIAFPRFADALHDSRIRNGRPAARPPQGPSAAPEM
ncbi:MAG TPA: cation:proton antiporter [Thermoplasmata archaeon]|nr:cation:proton antiporter [Thermoplasmata archaeon]HTW56381.1 cation:proton antiporter [Thermoplasmata archaeon]